LIYIDTSKLSIPQRWKDDAKRAIDNLKNIPDSGRSDFINRNSHIWQSLKTELERISHNKCWYCEAKNTRADFHVDHHRPKNRIRNRDGTEEPGYWWLAFDHRNFRLACSYCNCPHKGADGITRGKSDQFPLRSNSIRASSPGSNLDDETALLLDPTNPADPLLLWFQNDGNACPRYSKGKGFPHQRAKVTIDILNLNDIKIVEARKELWNRCVSLIERGDKAFAQYQKGSATGIKEFEMVIREIRKLIQSSAEFSATARACFRGSSYDWVRETVQ
jgi:uncharacterized protein (TIGR02646 family)